MTPVAALLLVLSQPAPAGIPAPADQRVTIIRLVLAASTARTSVEAQHDLTCVSSETRPSLTSEHALRTMMNDAVRFVQRLRPRPARSASSPTSVWAIAAPNSSSSQPPRFTTVAEGRRLDAALDRALAMPEGAAGRIEPGDIPTPFVPEREGRPCDHLGLSEPAIVGDLAFVETAFNCGDLCGNGAVYALERQADHWVIVGIKFTWVS